MVCSQCGAENADGAGACLKCSQDLMRPAPADSFPRSPGSPGGQDLRKSVGEAGPTLPPERESASAGAAEAGVRPRALVEGRYRIERLLGRGGMGSVWKAVNERLDEPCALKFISPRLCQSPSARERLLREAKACRSLIHENIVRVHDVGEWQGQVYLVMEYVHGLTLQQWLARRRAKGASLEWRQVSAILRQVLVAVVHAHSRGVIHRDLKPSNIMLAPRDDRRARVVIMDFGLAKVEEAPGRTRLGAGLGTAYYMAPEQLTGAAQVDARADLYSLGVIAYEMLTGRLPIGAQPSPPSRDRADLPDGLDGWVFQAIQSEAEKRFASAEEMAEALERLGKPASLPDGGYDWTSQALDSNGEDLFFLGRDTAAELERAGKKPQPAAPGAAAGEAWRRKKRRLILAALAIGAVFVMALAVIAALTSPPPMQHGGTGILPVTPPVQTPAPQPTGKMPVPPQTQIASPPPSVSPTPLSSLVPRPSSLASPGSSYTEAANGVNLEMIWIPGGTFQMGSPDSEKERDSDEGPVHSVTLDSFWLGKTEVTQAQYQAVMGSNPSYFKGAENPVETVSWDDATEFCRKLSGASGKTYGLPTEAQWEYACRVGSQSPFCFGDDESRLGEYAWYTANSGSQTHPVGQKKPNAFGLYDVHGNVWEWCADWFEQYTASAVSNPGGPASGSLRVNRGGGWHHSPRRCRAAIRHGVIPLYRFNSLGFRVAGPAVR